MDSNIVGKASRLEFIDGLLQCIYKSLALLCKLKLDYGILKNATWPLASGFDIYDLA